jgi:hypothetical protein
VPPRVDAAFDESPPILLCNTERRWEKKQAQDRTAPKERGKKKERSAGAETGRRATHAMTTTSETEKEERRKDAHVGRDGEKEKGTGLVAVAL